MYIETLRNAVNRPQFYDTKRRIGPNAVTRSGQSAIMLLQSADNRPNVITKSGPSGQLCGNVMVWAGLQGSGFRALGWPLGFRA